jgi:hypothetical protein
LEIQAKLVPEHAQVWEFAHHFVLNFPAWLPKKAPQQTRDGAIKVDLPL